MNPSAFGFFGFVVAGVKYAAILRVVSVLTVAPVLSFVVVCPCNPDAAKITKPTPSKSAVRSVFVVDFFFMSFTSLLVSAFFYGTMLLIFMQDYPLHFL